MENKKPLLSICIPTYNRCECLDKTIASIVSDPHFNTEKVELVISDNCSEDNTQKVVEKYMQQYNNIIYNRNPENIRDSNFITAIKLGNGEFLKLYNDTALFLEGTLPFLLQTIKNNIETKPVLFFPNGSLLDKRIEEKQCNSFNEFVSTTSFYSTWIGGFGIWRDELRRLTNIERGIALQLWQTDILFRLASQKTVIVYNQKLVKIQNLEKKGGYNIFAVFGNNYLSLYEEYLEHNLLSRKTFKQEKKKLFRFFFLCWIKKLLVVKSDVYYFEISDAFKILFRHYKTYAVFYLGLGYLVAYKYWYIIKKK